MMKESERPCTHPGIGTVAPDRPIAMQPPPRPDIHQPPTVQSALLFRAKATLLQFGRMARNLAHRAPLHHPSGGQMSEHPCIAESTTLLWGGATPSERQLLAGKVHNLRIALSRLHTVEVPAGALFSFWGQIGRASRWKGYAKGRELREGCLIPSIGGGLCQLSGALYDAALQAGFQIVERHPHSIIIPGSAAEHGRDATVFWNYIDLRFRSPHAFRIEATMDATTLTIRLRGRSEKTVRPLPVVLPPPPSSAHSAPPQSCASCDVHDCFRHTKPQSTTGRTAYLVDGYWPEFDSYLQQSHGDHDMLLLPLDGRAFKKEAYAWNTNGFPNIHKHTLWTLLRSARSRRLAMQGAARQQFLLAANEHLAARYASLLPHDVAHVTVMQHLVPFLWRHGHLGGRTFDVLMTSLPLRTLHDRLDRAASLHPESTTLADFRADAQLLRDEEEALRYARRIITPHTEIASQYPDTAVKLEWALPHTSSTTMAAGTTRTTLLFPASTLGRKGAYELRTALQGLDVHLLLLGPQLEGENFWQGLSTERIGPQANWHTRTDAAVLPAFVEHAPRRLLTAISLGIPVIASTACGLENMQGTVTIPPGDTAALRGSIEAIIRNRRNRPE